MKKLFEQLEVWFSAELGLQQKVGPIVMDLIILAVLLVLAFIANYVAKRFILKLVEHFASKSSTKWDDVLVKRKFFRRLIRGLRGVRELSAGQVVLQGSGEGSCGQPRSVRAASRAASSADGHAGGPRDLQASQVYGGAVLWAHQTQHGRTAILAARHREGEDRMEHGLHGGQPWDSAAPLE